MVKAYYFIYLFWLLPSYLLLMGFHQVNTYYGLTDTYENGKSYVAEVIDFDITQIAAQTNGYIDLRFEPDGGEVIERRLSQPIQNAAQLQASEFIAVRYKPDSSQEIVLMPIYDFHRTMVLANLGVLGIAFLVTLTIAIFAHRFASRKIRMQGADEPEFVRVDTP